MTGAERLAGNNFADLSGQRVGLIANHTSVVRNRHLADLLAASRHVELTAIFAPEHGFRGDVEAGARITNNRDPQTGVFVHSLYGKTKAPTQKMLRNVDTLLFDIQDVGVRFYTYASTMGLAMQAAARNGKTFIVLDRPNPLNGDYVSGYITDKAYISFVGQYPIPVAHGMTLGELAGMIKGEQLLPGLEKLDLQVVKMRGWKRSMRWTQTGRPWTNPSPNIVDFKTALVYPGTALIEGTHASEGRGTMQPFSQIGTTWLDAGAIARALNKNAPPGVRFAATRFTPKRIPGMSESPKLNGKPVAALRIDVTDIDTYQPLETGIYILSALTAQARSKRKTLLKRSNFFELLAGTKRLRNALNKGRSPNEIIMSWRTEVDAFKTARAPYLLY